MVCLMAGMIWDSHHAHSKYSALLYKKYLSNSSLGLHLLRPGDKEIRQDLHPLHAAHQETDK